MGANGWVVDFILIVTGQSLDISGQSSLKVRKGETLVGLSYIQITFLILLTISSSREFFIIENIILPSNFGKLEIIKKLYCAHNLFLQRDIPRK